MNEILILTGVLCTGSIAGYYSEPTSPGKPTITICQGYENDDFTLQHEYGHYIYPRLAPKIKEYWSKLHDSSSGDDFLRQYSKKSAEEDFCDVYAHVKTNRVQWSDDSRILKKKFRFMEKLLQYLKLR